jgi:ferredoxin
MMRIQVDWNKCTGIGMCESLHPDLFEVGDDGKLQLLRGEDVPDDRAADVDAAIAACPTGALSRLG